MKIKLENLFLSLTFAAIFGGIILLAWIIWSMFANFTFLKAPEVWTVTNQISYPGDDVFGDVSFCKYTNLPADIGRMITGKGLDGETYVFPQPNVSGTFPDGCYQARMSLATLPLNIPPGKYKVYISLSYEYSVFRTVHHNFVSEEFEVYPKIPGEE